ncbi:MAG: TRAP transporter large permease subunit [Desulfatiglandaceae bacterium]
MNIELITLILFGGLLSLLALGVPVAFALGGLSLIFAYFVEGPQALYTVATTTYSQITSPGLMAIPLFLVMANFLVHSGISERLFHSLSYWLTGLRGGLAIVSIIVCVALAMCGGFGPGVLTMGLVAVPAMLKHNYQKSLALGSVMAGGVLGIIIPPSILMIIFGYISRVSIGKLFFAGIVPGFLCAFLFVVYIIAKAYLQPDSAPVATEIVTWRKRVVALKDIILPGLLIILVLGSIFVGAATPTEAAGVGAMGAFLICIIHGRLTWKVIFETCKSSINISGMALWILIGATLFGVVYTSAGAQDLVMEFIEGIHLNRWFVLFGMQLVLIVFGMFMDDYAIVTICAPIFLPIAKFLGFDPIWFSIIFILNMQVAYLTPPFGWSLILMKGVAPPSISTADIWRSVPPFVVIQIFVLILVMIVPQFALWLPGLMF